MIFTLEALQAKQGDCLILHYGSSDNPRVLLIDGGPGGVYQASLRPRLLEIRDRLTPGAALPLAMVMVSHMDDDHVNGVLDLTDEIREAEDDDRSPDFDIEHLWFNAFDDIVGSREIPRISTLETSATVADLMTLIPDFSTLDNHIAAVIASTGQGRQLRKDAQFLSIPVNNPFDAPSDDQPPFVRGDTKDSLVDWEDGLMIEVIHPGHQRLVEMQKKWDNDLKKAAREGDESIIFASLSDRDKSPFNLASIVCLVHCDGKRMLLTGDARGDDIVDGLRRGGNLNDEGRIHVDILKLPHHGSDRNVSRDFFETVTADHYVISGNGEHKNPDKSTLVMLSMATRGRDDFTIHMTNHDGKHDLKANLDEFISDDRARGRTYRFEFRQESALSLKVDLLDQIDY